MKVGKIMEDQCHLNAKKTKRTLWLVTAVPATVEKYVWVTVSNLALAHKVSVSTILPSFTKNWS